jgi:hypothetical protein
MHVHLLGSMGGTPRLAVTGSRHLGNQTLPDPSESSAPEPPGRWRRTWRRPTRSGDSGARSSPLRTDRNWRFCLLIVTRGANAGDARRGNLTRPSRHAVGYAEPNQALQPPRPARSPIGVRHEETTKPITQQPHQFRSRTSAWSVPRGTLESRWPPFSRSDQERHKSVLSRRRQRRGTPRHRVGLEYRIVGLTSEFLGVRLGHAAI